MIPCVAYDNLTSDQRCQLLLAGGVHSCLIKCVIKWSRVKMEVCEHGGVLGTRRGLCD